MCSVSERVSELVRTLRALDAGKETKAIRECMADVYSTHQLLRQYVAHYPVRRRAERAGVWVKLSTLGMADAPTFIPVDVPFTVWEKSATQPHVEMNEYTLAFVSEFQIPSWVHESSDLGKAFENWFVGAPTETSAALGSATLVENTLRRGLKSPEGQPLLPRHFLCGMLRNPKCAKKRVNGIVQDVDVAAKSRYALCFPRQNYKYDFFEDGSETFPFTMCNWLKLDRKEGPWEKYPLMLPPGHPAVGEIFPPGTLGTN